jgi:hypothetical protein
VWYKYALLGNSVYDANMTVDEFNNALQPPLDTPGESNIKKIIDRSRKDPRIRTWDDRTLEGRIQVMQGNTDPHENGTEVGEDTPDNDPNAQAENSQPPSTMNNFNTPGAVWRGLNHGYNGFVPPNWPSNQTIAR